MMGQIRMKNRNKILDLGQIIYKSSVYGNLGFGALTGTSVIVILFHLVAKTYHQGSVLHDSLTARQC